MKAIEITENIYWVGAIDWAVRDFHGYATPHGTTYNDYLLIDDEITLIDTVKYDFSDVLLHSIAGIVDPSRIRHVVVNHIEDDHVTSLDGIMRLAPDALIHITAKGRKGLERFFDISKWKMREVKTGDTLTTGKHTLMFIETPMLHWPDSMMTYVKEAKLLFSQDGFGQHYASSARFDDEFVSCQSMAELEDAVVDYYANILMPFGNIIKAKLADIQKLGLEIDMIAPDHGIIWRSHPDKVVQMYSDMANGKSQLSISIIYDTMWHSTEKMIFPRFYGHTERLGKINNHGGVKCKVVVGGSTAGSSRKRQSAWWPRVDVLLRMWLAVWGSMRTSCTSGSGNTERILPAVSLARER
jgi:anaerobic nitric oxide reductase flavorubredoxin